MKKILGLDLGTNSIGWAVINQNDETNRLQGIDSAGSRIIPMDASILGDFNKGNSVSQTAERTQMRGTRRLHERYLLRRERLNRVLNVMGFLPTHYSEQLDKYGHFLNGSEPKLAWNKGCFVFMDSFNEMLADFAKHQAELVAGGKKIPFDWTIYYLRKKALTQAITKEELAWILFQFNQKRGYNQLRDEEEEEKKNQIVEYYSLRVVDIEDSGDRKGNNIWYNVKLENGWVYRRASAIPLDWVGKTKDFIVTTDLNEDGSVKTDKDGKEKRTFRAPKEDDWGLLKKKTEYSIENSGMMVGEYIYNSLLNEPSQKINGQLVRTIDRKYYKAELRAILNKQRDFIPELNDRELYYACIQELYPSNEDFRHSIEMHDFSYLLVDDILFYQRPLKSKKSTIANCPYESHYDQNGNVYPIKCAAKSNPYFQEFRLWQFISNLKIFERSRIVEGRLKTDIDVTEQFLPTENDRVALFDFLNDKKEISQDSLLTTYFKIKKGKGKDIQLPYRWNYVEDKSYPCNKTRANILAKLTKEDKGKLTTELEYSLWHLLYSVKSKNEIDAVFSPDKHTNRQGIYHDLVQADFSAESIESLKKAKFDETDYASYSEKAIKKLLSLMRQGHYWNKEAIDIKTQDRINKIITGEYDEKIRNRVREKSIYLTDISHFKGLPVWLACYIIYDRHSEASDIQKWHSPQDIDKWLKEFKQHSLRNPIVEQVITETMRTVRDIWKQTGQIDEIHVELGREMKNPAEQRAKLTAQISENENTNLRIKAMLMEFQDPSFGIENVRPYSPTQQDILRIYEEGAIQNLSSSDDDYEFVSKISKAPQPTKNEVLRYKCWLEQKYQSPYTGEIIPLAKLFTPAYEIEHIIPQSKYFDDSFSNKVICEAEVNKLKDNQLGYEFIKSHRGEKVTLSGGKVVEIFGTEAYQEFVTKHYSRNRSKMKKLLMDEIPDQFIERQLNDSRYISKYVKGILSNIVREADSEGNLEQEAVSKNLISCNGNITDRLKKDWGMNDVWNRIILPRFIRLNEMTGTTNFTTKNSSGELIPNMPLELQKGFTKKRIDHRHHAMDAIVIACTTRDHVNLLNNETAMSEHKENRYALSHKLRRYEEVFINGEKRMVPQEFLKPWDTFTQDAYNTLSNIIVSFKQNLRVINKTVNKYEHFNVDGKKVLVKQDKGDNWSIRKSMHKDTVFGEVNLRFIKEVNLKDAITEPQRIVDKELKHKVFDLIKDGHDSKAILKYFIDNPDIWPETTKKIQVYYYTKETKNRYFATRFISDLVSYFDKVTKYEDAIKKIEGITDTGIQKILKAHLAAKDNDPVLAFCADGIDEMNSNIVALNDGKPHKPIFKVRRFEQGSKFPIGQHGNKKRKYVEADKGTSLCTFVYEKKDINGTNSRKLVPVSLIELIIAQKKAGTKWTQLLDSQLREQNEIDSSFNFLFTLSPMDLVYVPSPEEIQAQQFDYKTNKIYKVVSLDGENPNFILASIATMIVDKLEFTRHNKTSRSLDDRLIKGICIPIQINRLGTIVKFNNHNL